MRALVAVAAIVTAAGFAAPASAATGLVAAYGFEETTGATTADASGNNNTGTLNGPTRSSAGKHGAALAFDGTNDRVSVPDSPSLDFTGALTLEAWVNPTSVAGYRTIVMKETPGLYNWALYGSTTTGLPNGRVVTSADLDVKNPTKLPLNTWTHIALTYDGSTLRMYTGGQQTASRPVTGPLTTSDGTLQIGGNTIWQEWFKGRLDDLRIYDRALTPSEIQTDATTPVG
jgi:Concanavalin A-like lectin/glucanases superfamily